MLFDLSITIQHNISQHLQTTFGEFADIRAKIKGGDSQILNDIAEYLDQNYSSLLMQIKQHYDVSEWQVFTWADQDPQFHPRVQQLILERVMSEPLAAKINVIPKGLVAHCATEKIELPFACPQAKLHGVVVEHLAHAVNEIYPLMIDAYVFSLSRNLLNRWNVIGVHDRWLDDHFSATRGFYYDPNHDQIIEHEFLEPLQLNRIQTLCISPKKHIEISARALENQTPDLNPYIKAMQADDKFACYQQWNALGIFTPVATLIDLNSNVNDDSLIKPIKEFFLQLVDQYQDDRLDQEIHLFLQPNHGTEGQGVRVFSGPTNWETFIELNPELLLHARTVLSDDNLILRQGIGNVLWCDLPEDPGKWFDLRLNVVDNTVESGYLMIGNRHTMITSPSQQGRVVEWNHQKEWRLRTPDGLEPFGFEHQSWSSIEETAIAACKPYNSCRLLGLDVRLCKQGNQWQAWVLDINPRPSGLSHSRFVNNAEPGVSLKLWEH